MGVPLHIVLGILLALTVKSQAKTLHSRHQRDTIFPLQLSNQNGSEKINNRDLNKIKIELPKTEIEEHVNISKNKKTTEANVDNNDKNVNNDRYHNKVPLADDNLGSSESNLSVKVEENKNNKNETTKQKKEEKNKYKNEVEKEIDKLGTGRSIDSDTSKFWSTDFHNKNNVFTLSSSGDNQKFFHEDEEETLLEPNFSRTTFSANFDIQSDLTTPETHFFDKKFKEAVDSIEQNLEVNDNEEEGNPEVEDELSEIKIEDLDKDRKHGAVEYTKTKSIINNENVGKNSHHKDVDVEETKNISVEKVYNDTTVYDSDLENSKDEKNQISEAPSSTTNKITVDSDKSTNYLLSNKIETESLKPSTSTPVITTITNKIEVSNIRELKNSDLATTLKKNLLEPIEHNIIPLQLSESDKDQKGSFSDSKIAVQKYSELPITSSPTKMAESNSEKSIVDKTSTENAELDDFSKIITTKKLIEDVPTTDSISTTEDSITATMKLDSVTTQVPDTTTHIVVSTEITAIPKNIDTKEENLITTSEITTIPEETSTIISTEKNSRKYKFEETTLKENTSTVKVESENSTTAKFEITTLKLLVTTKFSDYFEKETTENLGNVETTTFENIKTTVTNTFDERKGATLNRDIDETTINMNIPTTKKIKTEEITTTTLQITTAQQENEPTESIIETTTTLPESTNFVTRNNSENITENDNSAKTTTEEASTPKNISDNATENVNVPKTTTDEITTTEFAFVHIKKQDENHTTIVPDILGPSFDYSTSENQPFFDENVNNTDVELNNRTDTLTVVTTITENVATTTEESTNQAPTEELTNDGGTSKGTIAAIAISCVGALCLVLLGVLLYVMRKRRKRFKYGPRCTPVSLDEYSIDNLSVYNSVRRKGQDRMSKRSFGNPAFEDPSGVSHPLNFPALSKFSTNIEDINAEYEEIPQIHARTSELPDGCDAKNRYANVIALPETRVFLKSIDGIKNSDYINANYVTGPKNIRGYYIATQGPMQNTVEDFWRMIWEQQVKVVLMLTHLVENGLEKCVDYLPESEVVDNHRLFGDFQVTLKKREVKDKYIISSLQLKNMVSNSWREITHFWYLGWPEKGVPSEANSLIAFLIEARSYMKTATIDKRNEINSSTIQNGGPSSEHNPVVVHCSPGTGRTGVAMACDIAIQEFETTRLVDIPKILYRIRRDRANSVQSKEQYQFIYKVVSLYATKLTGGQFLKE